MNNLDRAINNDLLVVSKSLLPYLNMDRQKPLAIFIKVMELIYTVNLFSNEASIRSMSRSQESGWERNFLNDVKNNLSEDKAHFIDVILKLNEAKSLLSRQDNPDSSSGYYSSSDYHMHPNDSGIPEDSPFPDMPQTTPPNTSKRMDTANRPTSNTSSPNPEQLINSLSSMLDPNQKQLLKMLTSLLMPQQPPQQ